MRAVVQRVHSAECVVDGEIVSKIEKIFMKSGYTFGYPVIGRLEEFTKYCKNVVSYETDTFVLDADTKAQTVILNL